MSDRAASVGPNPPRRNALRRRSKERLMATACSRRVPTAMHVAALSIVTRMRSERRGLQDIADHLNDEGFVTRMGATWTATQVKRVLDRAAKQPVLIGPAASNPVDSRRGFACAAWK